jgi:hypothetical protein
MFHNGLALGHQLPVLGYPFGQLLHFSLMEATRYFATLTERTLALERATGAGLAIIVHDNGFAFMLALANPLQSLARGTPIAILLGLIHKGLLRENLLALLTASAGGALGGHVSLNTFLPTAMQLLALMIARVGYGLELVHPQFLFGR